MNQSIREFIVSYICPVGIYNTNGGQNNQRVPSTTQKSPIHEQNPLLASLTETTTIAPSSQFIINTDKHSS